jgi:cytidylate kinase
MQFNTLTIEREYGSGGTEIASEIAEHLGWKLWDQLLTTEIAHRLECPKMHVEEHEESIDTLTHRLFKAFLRGSFEGSLNAPRLKLADTENIRKVTEQIVRSAAKDGNCVIVGRGSAYYLRGLPNVFHAFVYAPFENKVRRIQQRGKSEQEAIHLTETVDHDRAAFIKEQFGLVWPPREFFHVMANSAMGDDSVVQTILGAMHACR